MLRAPLCHKLELAIGDDAGFGSVIFVLPIHPAMGTVAAWVGVHPFLAVERFAFELAVERHLPPRGLHVFRRMAERGFGDNCCRHGGPVHRVLRPRAGNGC